MLFKAQYAGILIKNVIQYCEAMLRQRVLYEYYIT